MARISASQPSSATFAAPRTRASARTQEEAKSQSTSQQTKSRPVPTATRRRRQPAEVSDTDAAPAADHLIAKPRGRPAGRRKATTQSQTQSVSKPALTRARKAGQQQSVAESDDDNKADYDDDGDEDELALPESKMAQRRAAPSSRRTATATTTMSRAKASTAATRRPRKMPATQAASAHPHAHADSTIIASAAGRSKKKVTFLDMTAATAATDDNEDKENMPVSPPATSKNVGGLGAKPVRPISRTTQRSRPARVGQRKQEQEGEEHAKPLSPKKTTQLAKSSSSSSSSSEAEAEAEPKSSTRVTAPSEDDTFGLHRSPARLPILHKTFDTPVKRVDLFSPSKSTRGAARSRGAYLYDDDDNWFSRPVQMPNQDRGQGQEQPPWQSLSLASPAMKLGQSAQGVLGPMHDCGSAPISATASTLIAPASSSELAESPRRVRLQGSPTKREQSHSLSTTATLGSHLTASPRKALFPLPSTGTTQPQTQSPSHKQSVLLDSPAKRVPSPAKQHSRPYSHNDHGQHEQQPGSAISLIRLAPTPTPRRMGCVKPIPFRLGRPPLPPTPLRQVYEAEQNQDEGRGNTPGPVQLSPEIDLLDEVFAADGDDVFGGSPLRKGGETASGREIRDHTGTDEASADPAVDGHAAGHMAVNRTGAEHTDEQEDVTSGVDGIEQKDQLDSEQTQQAGRGSSSRKIEKDPSLTEAGRDVPSPAQDQFTLNFNQMEDGVTDVESNADADPYVDNKGLNDPLIHQTIGLDRMEQDTEDPYVQGQADSPEEEQTIGLDLVEQDATNESSSKKRISGTPGHFISNIDRLKQVQEEEKDHVQEQQDTMDTTPDRSATTDRNLLSSLSPPARDPSPSPTPTPTPIQTTIPIDTSNSYSTGPAFFAPRLEPDVDTDDEMMADASPVCRASFLWRAQQQTPAGKTPGRVPRKSLSRTSSSRPSIVKTSAENLKGNNGDGNDNTTLRYTPLVEKFSSWRTSTLARCRPRRSRSRKLFSPAVAARQPAAETGDIADKTDIDDGNGADNEDEYALWSPHSRRLLTLFDEEDDERAREHAPSASARESTPSLALSRSTTPTGVALSDRRDREDEDEEENEEDGEMYGDENEPPLEASVPAGLRLNKDETNSKHNSPAKLSAPSSRQEPHPVRPTPSASLVTPVRAGTIYPRVIHTVSKVPLRGEQAAEDEEQEPDTIKRGLFSKTNNKKRSRSLSSAGAVGGHGTLERLVSDPAVSSPPRKRRSPDAGDNNAPMSGVKASLGVQSTAMRPILGEIVTPRRQVSAPGSVPDWLSSRASRASRSPSPTKSAKSMRSSMIRSISTPDSAVHAPANIPDDITSVDNEFSLATSPQGILTGTVIYTDVHTAEGADASGLFIELLTQMGARCVRSWNWTPEGEVAAAKEKSNAGAAGGVGVTHVVFKDGSARTLDKVRAAAGRVRCVGVGWVLDCERYGRRVAEGEYMVDVGGGLGLSALNASRGAIAEIKGELYQAKSGASAATADYYSSNYYGAYGYAYAHTQSRRRKKSMEPRALENVNGSVVRLGTSASFSSREKGRYREKEREKEAERLREKERERRQLDHDLFSPGSRVSPRRSIGSRRESVEWAISPKQQWLPEADVDHDEENGHFSIPTTPLQRRTGGSGNSVGGLIENDDEQNEASNGGDDVEHTPRPFRQHSQQQHDHDAPAMPTHTPPSHNGGDPGLPHTPEPPSPPIFSFVAGAATPFTPFTPFRPSALVQQTCPPKQTRQGLFDSDADADSGGNGMPIRGGLQERLEAARRKSLAWKPKVGSPLVRGYVG